MTNIESGNRAVLYVRVSSDEQAKGYSPDAQLKLLREYAANHNFNIVAEFNESQSATYQGRMEFARMIETIKRDKIPVLLFEKADRMSRNPIDANVVIDLIENRGLQVCLVKSGSVINRNSSPPTKFSFYIEIGMALYFSWNLREETKKGMREKVQRGGYPCLAPIGYINKHLTDGEGRVIEKIIVPDPERAPLIKHSFELYASGEYSLATLRDWLNGKGLKTRKFKKKITIHGLEVVLHNSFYYGLMKWGGMIQRGKHEPIISKELFDKVQDRFAERHRPNPRGLFFTFKGVGLKCGYCGCSIVAERQTGKLDSKTYVYYHCTESRGKCQQAWYREEDLERMFADEIGKLKFSDQFIGLIKQALKNAHEEEERTTKETLTRLQGEYSLNETKLHKIYDDKLEGVIPEDFFKSKFTDLQNRQIEIREEIAKLGRKTGSFLEQSAEIFELMKDLKNQYVKANSEQKQKIMKILVSNWELKDVNTRIYWNKPFDMLFEMGQTKKWGE